MIRKATKAQHGHTPAMQLVYETLWSHGKEEGPNSRISQIGFARICTEARLDKTTVSQCLKRLRRVFSIDLIAPYVPVTSSPCIYRVYSYSEILRLRKAAGMLWISRLGHFVPAPEHAIASEGPKASSLIALVVAAPDVQSVSDRQAHIAGAAIGEDPSDRQAQIAKVREMMSEYVNTDRNGHPIAFPPEWAKEAPSAELARQIGELVGWDVRRAVDFLMQKKRDGYKPDKSYGWFFRVLASNQWPRSGDNDDEQALRDRQHGQE